MLACCTLASIFAWLPLRGASTSLHSCTVIPGPAQVGPERADHYARMHVGHVCLARKVRNTSGLPTPARAPSNMTLPGLGSHH